MLRTMWNIHVHCIIETNLRRLARPILSTVAVHEVILQLGHIAAEGASSELRLHCVSRFALRERKFANFVRTTEIEPLIVNFKIGSKPESNFMLRFRIRGTCTFPIVELL